MLINACATVESNVPRQETVRALLNKNASVIAASRNAFRYKMRTDERKREVCILMFFSQFLLSPVVSTGFAFILNFV
jgi:hypothetical protein